MSSNYWFGIGSLMPSRKWGIEITNSTMDEDLSSTKLDLKSIDCRYILRQFDTDRIGCFVTGGQRPDRSIGAVQVAHIFGKASSFEKLSGPASGVTPCR